MRMASIDRVHLADKIRVLANKVDDILEHTRLDYPAEMDMANAAASLRSAASDVEPRGDYHMARCSLCGLLQAREMDSCGACGKGDWNGR